MKLSNIFKKETKTVSKANVETLAKNQLEKVIGGDTSIPAPGRPPKGGGGTVTGTIIITSGT